jgi:hypothetical protein
MAEAAAEPQGSGRGRARRAVAVTLVAAVALVVAFMLAPPLGTDLSAQVARADFFRGYGFAPVDFRWYGGVSPFGYSLVSPAVMAGLGGGTTGAKLAGALAAVVSSLALVLLFLRTGARRPALAGALGAVCFAGNLVSGRITYALGVVFGLLALLALTQLQRVSTESRLWKRGWWWALGALVGAALAAVTSPVAGLFVGLAGVALSLAGAGRSRLSVLGGALLVVGAALPMGVVALFFGSGGWMNISRNDTIHAVGTGVAVAILAPRPAIRIGALLSALGVAAAFVVHTPVGLNATRLATMFALPVLAGYAALPERWRIEAGQLRYWRAIHALGLAAVLVGGYLWQPPVLRPDLADAGNPTAHERYFRPLLAELSRRGTQGRIEVISTRDYWESAHVGDTMPLARGWLRQADLAYNGLFFDGSLNADRYRDWLWANGVSYVALPDAKLSWLGRREAELVRGGLPYLTQVWSGGGWVLYGVTAGVAAPAPSIVEGGRLVVADADGVTVEVGALPSGAAEPGAAARGAPGGSEGDTQAGLAQRQATPSPGGPTPAGGASQARGKGEDVLVRVRYSRWLAVQGPAGACLARSGEWTVLRVGQPGRYRITGSLTDRGPAC